MTQPPEDPEDVTHIKAKDDDGNVQAHLIVWGDYDEQVWIRASDDDTVNLYSQV
jgi:hypothetical protein